MLRRVGKNIFGSKYLIESSRKSLSISALQRGTRYDKIDRDAKLNEIKHETDPAKKKALMRDLLRGYEVKKESSETVPHLEQTLFETNVKKNNSYVRLNLYIYYLINYGSLRKLFGGRVAADFKENPLEDVGIERGRSHTEIVEFQKDRIMNTFGLEYNEELAINTIGMPSIDYRWKHLMELGIISNAKYESVTKKWESFSNDDILSFQSNYLKENGLELKAEEDIGPAFYVKSPESSFSSVDIRTDIVTDEVYLDEYKDRLRKFMEDPTEFKLDTMAQLFQKGKLKNTDCALYLAYKVGAVMRMPYKLNSLLSSRSVWESLAEERGIEIDFNFFEVYKATAAMYDTEADKLTEKLDKFGKKVETIDDIHKTGAKFSSNQMSILEKEREKTISTMRETQKSRDIVRAKREIIEYTLFQKLLNLPNFVSMESNSNSGLIGIFNYTLKTETSNQNTISLNQIYDKFGCLHANTRLVSGGKHSPHYTSQMASLESRMLRVVEDELFDLDVDQISAPSLFSSFISEVLYGQQTNMSDFSQAASNLPISSFDCLASLYSTFVAARMKSPSEIFFSFGEDYSKKTDRYSKIMSLLSLANQGQPTDEQFEKQLQIHRSILDKLNVTYRMIELNPKQMEPSAYRSVAIELKSSNNDNRDLWVPYTRINHKRDFVTSKLAIYYEERVPVRCHALASNFLAHLKDESQLIKYKKKFSHSIDSKADLRSLFEVMILKNATSSSSIAIPDALVKYFKNQTVIEPQDKFLYAGRHAPGLAYGEKTYSIKKFNWPGYENDEILSRQTAKEIAEISEIFLENDDDFDIDEHFVDKQQGNWDPYDTREPPSERKQKEGRSSGSNISFENFFQ